jgi:aminocarboxymuconate-semialdehyde decarboxylase
MTRAVATGAHTPAIDVHTHFVPEHLALRPNGAQENTWPSMAPAQSCCHRHVMIAGSVYRTVTDQCWDAPRRIEDMAPMGITHQVLSPMPELLSYWMPAKDAQVLLRDINEQMARLVAAHPDKFSALAAVPLQDVDMAIAELEYAKNTLHMAGVEIGSNINGRPIGAPEFDPFFAAAARLDMAVFVHAIRPAGMERLIGPPIFEQALGFPNEIGVAAASAITSNMLVRHPTLRIAFSHGGGSLAMLLPRLQHAWNAFPVLRETMQVAPDEQARRLFYDTLVYDKKALRYLVERFGAERLMVGTDYPFAILETDPLGRLVEAGFDAATVTRLRHDTAAHFLSGHAAD